jgi:YD repeat-containing protein
MVWKETIRKSVSFCLLAFIVLYCQISYSATIVYTYDNLNRLTKVVYGDATTEEFTYDAAGNRLNHVIKEPDISPPTGTITINEGATYTNSPSVTLTISANDDSGLTEMCISNTTSCSSWGAYTTSKTWDLLSGDEEKTVYIWFKDGAGNVNNTPFSDSIILDTTPPRGSILINTGDSYTNTTSVTLTLSASDTGSGILQMCISNTSSCSSWEPYTTSKSWELTSGDGPIS